MVAEAARGDTSGAAHFFFICRPLAFDMNDISSILGIIPSGGGAAIAGAIAFGSPQLCVAFLASRWTSVVVSLDSSRLTRSLGLGSMFPAS